MIVVIVIMVTMVIIIIKIRTIMTIVIIMINITNYMLIRCYIDYPISPNFLLSPASPQNYHNNQYYHICYPFSYLHSHIQTYTSNFY